MEIYYCETCGIRIPTAQLSGSPGPIQYCKKCMPVTREFPAPVAAARSSAAILRPPTALRAPITASHASVHPPGPKTSAFPLPVAIVAGLVSVALIGALLWPRGKKEDVAAAKEAPAAPSESERVPAPLPPQPVTKPEHASPLAPVSAPAPPTPPIPPAPVATPKAPAFIPAAPPPPKPVERERPAPPADGSIPTTLKLNFAGDAMDPALGNFELVKNPPPGSRGNPVRLKNRPGGGFVHSFVFLAEAPKESIQFKKKILVATAEGSKIHMHFYSDPGSAMIIQVVEANAPSWHDFSYNIPNFTTGSWQDLSVEIKNMKDKAGKTPVPGMPIGRIEIMSHGAKNDYSLMIDEFEVVAPDAAVAKP